jgi:hypothetical protein
MSTRILHCGKSYQNYNLCLEHGVVGFTTRGPSIGDTIYVVVRDKKKTLCGMVGKIAEITDYKPWDDADRYVVSYYLEEIKYAKPFDVQFLSEVGGAYWSLKYLQQAKEIKKMKQFHF